jgi:nucleoside-diphosphate-sugar epimerase
LRILLTGASGFVGSATLAALLAENSRPSIVAVGRTKPRLAGDYAWHRVDLLDHAAVAALTADVRPDIVLHLAWCVEHGTFWTDPANLDWIAATLHLARAASENGARRFVATGTCYEYDWPPAGDCHETRTSLKPALLYGVAKDATRRVLSEFNASAGMSFAWARLFFLYGPHEGAGRLVPAIAHALIAGEDARCSSGKAIRDFLDVRDAGTALAKLALSEIDGALNIASGQAVTVADIARALGAIAGLPERIKLNALPDRSGEPPRIVADVTRAKNELNFAPNRDLETGLGEALAWWRSVLERTDERKGHVS